MRVGFLARFSRDIDAINSSAVKKAVERVILEAENSKSIYDVKNVKKMSGFKNAYRIRIGDYRIGLFYGTVQFARVVHRKDIYRVFP